MPHVRCATRLATATVLLLSAAGAWAHEGHGMGSVHWHATDTSGFLFVALLAGLALWLSRED
jgi:hypothetical protein